MRDVINYTITDVSFCFSRERLRRVLRKKTSAELRLIYIFTSSPLHIHILTYISAHLHIYIHNCTSTSLHIFTSSHRHLCSSSSSHIYISAHVHICTSLLIFTSSHLHLTSLPLIYISHLHLSLFLTFSLKAGGSAAGPPRNATLCGDRACRMSEMQARVRFGFLRRNLLRRSCASRARNAGESAICPGRGQPSAEIARVEGARCRRECDLSRNPLRRSCLSNARNAGESARWLCPAQTSAEIARVEGAKCRRECDLSGPEQPPAEIVRVEGAKCRRECDLSRSGATLCGDRACRGCEMQARVRFGCVRRNPLRRSCVSRVRNAGESASWLCPAQPSAEIVRVECALLRNTHTSAHMIFSLYLGLQKATRSPNKRESETNGRLQWMRVSCPLLQ